MREISWTEKTPDFLVDRLGWSQPDWLSCGRIVQTDYYALVDPIRVLASYPADDSESGILVDVEDAAGGQVLGIDSHWLREA